jgi:hypothetical protein
MSMKKGKQVSALLSPSVTNPVASGKSKGRRNSLRGITAAPAARVASQIVPILWAAHITLFSLAGRKIERT